MIDAKLISQAEWMYFLRGAPSVTNSTNANGKSPDASLVSDKSWQSILALEASFPDTFVNLSRNIASKIFNAKSFWKDFFDEATKEPHAMLFNLAGDESVRQLQIATYGVLGTLSSFQ